MFKLGFYTGLVSGILLVFFVNVMLRSFIIF
jgi:hypothetical protein